MSDEVENPGEDGGTVAAAMPSQHKTVAQAAAQLTRDAYSWNTTPGAPITVSYAFRASAGTNAATASSFSRFNSAQIDAAVQILALWSDVARVNFVRVGSGNSGAGAYSDYASIELGDYSDATDGSAAFAFMPSPYATAYTASAGDVWVNMNAYGNATPTIGSYGWMTLVHELGHTLGLEHPGDYDGVGTSYGSDAAFVEDTRQYTVMSYFSAAYTGADHKTLYGATPLLDDVAALQLLYGANTTTRVGNTTYGFNSNADRDVFRLTNAYDQRVMTIYDAGGTDTLNLSGYSTPQFIDLTPGAFSNTGSLTKNLSIAADTVIENAVGGSGDDTFVGNAADNAIDGGPGADTMILPGLRSEYALSRSGATLRAIDSVAGRGGTDTLTNIETVQFADGAIAAASIDAASFAIAASAAVRREGNAGTTGFVFTVIRTGDTTGSASLSWSVAGSGANPANAADFVGGILPSGTITFSAGQTSMPVVVNVAGDTVLEPDQTFTVTLSGPAGTVITTPTADGTIVNDDTVWSIDATDARKPEGDTGVTGFVFTVTRAGDSSLAATVAYAVSGSGISPASASDFSGGVLPTGLLSFAPNETQKTLIIPVTGDTQVENDEAFQVVLTPPADAVLGNGVATGTILSDESAFTISALDSRKLEGSVGVTPFNFVVQRVGDATAAAGLTWAVSGVGVNPAGPGDFDGGLFPTGGVAFAPGQTSALISVPVQGDLLVEPDKSFAVTLYGPPGTNFIANAAGATIVNDDTGYSIVATDARKAEGAAGTITNFVFNISRSGDATGPAVINYAIRGSGQNPADSADFVSPVGLEAVQFAAGEASRQILIQVAGDATPEPDETFDVVISSPSGALITTPSATGTILNDDTGYVLTAVDAVRPEGNAGVTPFTFVVTRVGNAAAAQTLQYSVAGIGATPPGPGDFAGGAMPSGSVSLAPGETAKAFTIPVLGDLAGEPDESFAVTLSLGATTLGTAVGTIVNDDAIYTLAATDAVKLEGQGGANPYGFTVTRTGDASAAATLTYSVAGSGGTPADASDFVGGAFPTGTVSFAPGETMRNFAVLVAGDTRTEPDETFTVTLGSPAGLTIAVPTAQGRIINDDVAPSIGISNGTTGIASSLPMDAAPAGGPSFLQWQYIYNGSDNVAMATDAPNTFLHSGSGNDAIQSGGGTNVLDGGLGSNFLTGGSGQDTFFTDARSPGVVWNTIRQFGAGDSATLWGFQSGLSSYRWDDQLAGAPGSQGATLRANIVGGGGRSGDGIDASITFAGLSVAQAKSLLVATGAQQAGPYLYLYNPGV